MACFIVPMVEAVAATIVRKAIGKSGNSFWLNNLSTLEAMLWGGTVMLIVDHAISGELLTMLSLKGGLQAIFADMLQVGLPMSLAITSLWVLVCVLRKVRASHKAAAL